MGRSKYVIATAALVLAGTVLSPGAAALAASEPAGPAGSAGFEAVQFARERGVSTAEAAQRLRWQTVAPDLAQRVRASLGTRFGGTWIDVTDGDRVKVGVVATAGAGDLATAARAASDLGVGSGVDVVRVRHSEAALDAAGTWLGQRIEALATQAGRTSLVAGIRTDRNAVSLQISTDVKATAAEQELFAQARATLGDMLMTGSYAGLPQSRACSYPYCDPPLRGGIAIHNNGMCTGGFIARSKVDDRLYQFTAGHCALGGRTDNWSTDFTNGVSHVIGPVHNHVFGGDGDAAIIRINNVGGWDPEAWVLVTNSPDTTADATYHISSDNISVVGMRICTTGAAYGDSSCGTVTELGLTVNYPEGTVHELGRATFCGVGGDSGSPMFAQHVAYGLQSGGAAECDSFYQGIRNAEIMLNVNVLHTNS